MNRRGFFMALGAGALAAHPLARAVGTLAPAPYVARYIYRTHALAYAITSGMVAEGEFANIGSLYAAHLAQSMADTRETLCANLLSRSFNS